MEPRAIGMVCAAGLHIPALKGRIQSLVLNDMAPEIAASAVERIKAYAGQPPAFATVPELEAFFRAAYAPFGELTDAQWRHLTETSTRRLPDGRVIANIPGNPLAADRNLHAQTTRRPRHTPLRPGYHASVFSAPRGIRPVAALRRAPNARADAARRKL